MRVIKVILLIVIHIGVTGCLRCAAAGPGRSPDFPGRMPDLAWGDVMAWAHTLAWGDTLAWADTTKPAVKVASPDVIPVGG